MSDTTSSDGASTLGGRYELGELLGHGGMADVRKAQDLRLNRTVAIKMLRTDLAREASFQARFRREAQSAASLNAPSIVAVYDTGEDMLDGARVPYIVMEYVEGQTLRELLRSGQRLLPDRALEITDGVLVALDYSHRHGIIHRDVKPANVMLSTKGEVKVMDFGIARAVADSGATMTQTANVLGTAQYLSPEQARGEVVDSRSDIYSAGCLLYELLTGRPPFQGESPVAVAYQHVRENPSPPSTVNPDVTSGMDAIAMKALAKNPENRYQSADEMRADIGRALAGASVTAPVVMDETMTQPIHAITDENTDSDKGSRRGFIALIIAVVVVLLLLAAGAWAMFGGGGAKIAVPDLSGMTQKEAEAALLDKGLVLGDTALQPSEEKKNTVISQNPPANTDVEDGTAVDLTISSGPEKIQVPTLVGLSRDAAIAEIQGAGLVVGEQKDQDSDSPADTVISSDPSEGTLVKVGTVVNLVISTGEVKIPNVVGLTQASATSTLEAQGFDVHPVFQQTTSSAPGIVLSQTPAGDSTAPRGTTVTITVSEAPPSPTQTTSSPAPTPTDSTKSP